MAKTSEHLEEATIRFAGDSGDGMQLIGTQFSETSGVAGNEVNTFPDYPSEIRAPEGTLYGVSAFQVHFGTHHIYTPGDTIDVLVAMNAASVKVNLPAIKPGGMIIANIEGFDERNLKLAKYTTNPLDDGSLSGYEVHAIDFHKEIKAALGELDISSKLIGKTKNIFALGLTYWLFQRPLDATIAWINKKFKGKDDIILANVHALRAGWNYAQKNPDFKTQYVIDRSALSPGRYRNITGNEAIALGLVVAAKKASMPLFLGSYPITPATDILHAISGYKKYGVKHLQAEDEIAGICSAIGAAYGGNLAVTTTSGPGLSLKTEAMGLAVMTELPLIIVDVQRAGPSTGMPTKPEQGDLLMAMFGRHGEAPMPILAAASPADCFDITLEAARIALKYMTPVLILSDGYIGQSSEPWKAPTVESLPEIKAYFATDPTDFSPYKRDEKTLRRQWAIPGFEGMEHRIGGLEKEDVSGNVSQDPANHEKMVHLRQEKVDRVAQDIPEAVVEGEQEGDLLMLSWGSTYGAAKTAYERMRASGHILSFVHLRYMNPFPRNLGDILNRFERIALPELNSGQLQFLLQAKYLKRIIGIHKVQGKPFKSRELEEKLVNLLTEKEILV
ncbi:2-oxoacid:acceptor oxidoreductase subunit alpha [uncultured Imperialibacter sp.]|uniref:2-oxoacid:acceptor oxidoreductase subunit alpha n=1 Tax=uncultured Imperialibacter sp. TaxID=1672639 RepID=UPI0030D928A1|tara:strand:- start:55640 stop:57487 length:1848 start_codon:yes stop_codon:yes gene_type:complete